MKTYTFQTQNVYVSSVKRIRFGQETYTYCGKTEYQPFKAAFDLATKRGREGAELFHFYDRDPCASEANILITEVLDASYTAQIRADRFTKSTRTRPV